jgi:uncharacterized protein YggE
VATVNIGVQFQSSTAQDAQAQVNNALSKALAAIKEAGIAEKDIRTSGLSLSPVYETRGPNEPPRQPEIVGYRAANTLQIRITNLARIGPIIDIAISNGVNRLQGISFDLSNDTEARQQSLREAVRQAQSKAKTIASVLAVDLDSIVEVQESGGQVMPLQRNYMAADAAYGGGGTPVEPGQIQIQSHVTVTYRILNMTRNPVTTR